jgi:hypothetical protein
MRSSLVKVLEKHGLKNPNFKAFVVNNVQENFNAIRRIFGLGDAFFQWLIKNAHVFFIGFNGWRNTRRN